MPPSLPANAASSPLAPAQRSQPAAAGVATGRVGQAADGGGASPHWTPGTRLRVDLQLCRAVQRGSWTAELSVPGVTGRLSFPSLRALGLYIARLETEAPAATAPLRPGDAPPPG